MKWNKVLACAVGVAALATSALAQVNPDPSKAITISGNAGFSASAVGYLGYSSTDSRGFAVAGQGGTLSITFSGTYTGVTVAEEETNDTTGLTGWYAVTCSDGTSAGSTTGTNYTCPVIGVRHRIRVSAYSTGTVIARVVQLPFIYGQTNNGPTANSLDNTLGANTPGYGNMIWDNTNTVWRRWQMDPLAIGTPYVELNLLNGDCSCFQRINSDNGGVYVALGASDLAARAASRVASTAAESSHVIKASAGNLYGCNFNSAASAGWFLLYDATSAPADGATTPIKWYQVATNTTLNIDTTNGGIPVRFSTGIVWVFSTTGPFTKTASATAVGSCEYK